MPKYCGRPGGGGAGTYGAQRQGVLAVNSAGRGRITGRGARMRGGGHGSPLKGSSHMHEIAQPA